MNYRQQIIERDLNILRENLDKLTQEEKSLYLSVLGRITQEEELTTHQFNYLQDIAKQVPNRRICNEASKKGKDPQKEE